jgi:hypothetical protein
VNATGLALAALVLVGGATGLWFRWARGVRLPRNRAGFVAAWLGGAVLGVTALAQGAGWLGGVAAVLALLVGGFLTFTVAISRQRVGVDAIQLGAKLPDFSALDDQGKRFAISSVAGRPILLKFFRGHW